MIGFLKSLFSGKKAETQEAPYKVETPVVDTPVVTAVGEPPATVVAVEGAGAVEVPTKPAPKKPAAMKAKKPSSKPKAPRKPKQPKAQ
jgi:hypothetical protein